MSVQYIVVLFIFVIIFLRFKRKNAHLKNDLVQKDYTIKELTQKLQEQEQNKSSYKEYKETENEIQINIEEYPENYYKLKSSCMNKNESRIFYYLNCALDEFLPTKYERENYFVFPQVSIHAFIHALPYIKAEAMLDNIASRNIVEKNVDFVICQRYKEDEYYLFKPFLLIEVDGSSHYMSKYGEKAFERQQNSDAFKDKLFASLNIPLIRYKMEQDRITRADRDKIKQELSYYFNKE